MYVTTRVSNDALPKRSAVEDRVFMAVILSVSVRSRIKWQGCNYLHGLQCNAGCFRSLFVSDGTIACRRCMPTPGICVARPSLVSILYLLPVLCAVTGKLSLCFLGWM